MWLFLTSAGMPQKQHFSKAFLTDFMKEAGTRKLERPGIELFSFCSSDMNMTFIFGLITGFLTLPTAYVTGNPVECVIHPDLWNKSKIWDPMGVGQFYEDQYEEEYVGYPITEVSFIVCTGSVTKPPCNTSFDTYEYKSTRWDLLMTSCGYYFTC